MAFRTPSGPDSRRAILLLTLIALAGILPMGCSDGQGMKPATSTGPPPSPTSWTG